MGFADLDRIPPKWLLNWMGGSFTRHEPKYKIPLAVPVAVAMPPGFENQKISIQAGPFISLAPWLLPRCSHPA